MTVTIELKPETEKRLVERARQKNLKIESFLEVFIEEKLDDETKVSAKEVEESVREATSEEWVAKLKTWSEGHDRTTPFLSDEATRRENIY